MSSVLLGGIFKFTQTNVAEGVICMGSAVDEVIAMEVGGSKTFKFLLPQRGNG